MEQSFYQKSRNKEKSEKSTTWILKVGVVEQSILNTPRITVFKLTSFFALFVFLLCRLMSGGFTIDSSNLRRNLNEHPIAIGFQSYTQRYIGHTDEIK
jgi:hypothetical protein